MQELSIKLLSRAHYRSSSVIFLCTKPHTCIVVKITEVFRIGKCVCVIELLSYDKHPLEPSIALLILLILLLLLNLLH